MSLLNSKFDVITQDNPMSPAALAITLDVASPPSPVFNTMGTPNAGTIYPGMIVTMDTAGKAVLATTVDVSANYSRKLFMGVVIDGNVDFSGRFVQKLTVLHGGLQMITDQLDLDGKTFTIGAPVIVKAGKVSPAGAATVQIFGYVGPRGYDAVNGTVHVIVPQGL